MAQIENWFTQDLKKPVKVQMLNGNLFSQDNQGNLIGVKVYDDDEPASLAGTVSANIIRADGGTVAATGTLDGNKCSVVLPAAAYAIPGLATIVIKLTSSGVVTTLLALVVTIYRASTDTAVDPGTVMPSIQTLIQQINTAVASIPADYSSLWTSLAPAFSTDASYVAGQYVTNNGKVYRFNTAHSGAWAAGDVSEVKLGNELTDLKSAVEYETESNTDFFEDELGITNYIFKYNRNKAIYTNDATIDVNNPQQPNNTLWKYCVIPCTEGDKFHVTVNLAASAFRPWAFVGADGTKLSVASANNVDVDLTAPANAVYLVCNVRIEETIISPPVYKVTKGTSRIASLENRTSAAESALTYEIDSEGRFLASNLGIREYPLINIGCIYTNSETINVDSIYADQRYRCVVIPCSPGDVFHVNISAANINFRPWAFVASDGTRKSVATENSVDMDVTAPADSAYLVCNARTEIASKYVVTSGENRIAQNTERISEIESTFNSLFDRPIEYTGFNAGYIDTNASVGSTISITPVVDENHKHIVIPCEENEQFMLQVRWGENKARPAVFCDSEYKILTKAVGGAISENYSYQWWRYSKYIFTAPTNAAYLICNHRIDSDSIQGYNPKVYKMPKTEEAIRVAQRVTCELPYYAEHDWEYMVVSTYKNMIVIFDYDTKRLRLSRDCGKTWNEGVDVSSLDNIDHYHLFANGCLAFFTATKAYYIEDWLTYNEASCYEQDGTAFVPQVDHNFNALWDHAERKFIGNQDIYLFGNYNLDRDGYRRILWYSIDNGHTYKIAYEFALQDTYDARHIHETIYYEPEDVYIVSTGDHNATECRVFAFEYDSTNDKWSETVLGGPIRDYKWACVAIWAEKLYYTFDSTPGKVMACKYADIGDISKHETILDGMECDSLSLGFSLTGELIVIQSTARSLAGQTYPINMTPYEATRKLYYSTDRKNFSTVIIPINYTNGMAVQSRIKPITSDGHCYIGQAYNNQTPSLRIDDYLHVCGYKNAFKPF